MPSQKALYIVRGREEERYWNATPVQSDAPFRLEGIFPTREQAERFQAERERIAAELGDPGPLRDLRYFDDLVKLSAFERGVFKDWLIDHDMPDPELVKFDEERMATSIDEWLGKLSQQQVTLLYSVLHHFRFYEIAEVPFIEGDYPQEEREEWERNLPPAPAADDWGFENVEDGFHATPSDTPPEGFWDEPTPPTGSSTPDDDAIPF